MIDQTLLKERPIFKPSLKKRYLMAVVFLDLTGYTRLMSKSEAMALNILQELEKLLREEIIPFRGHIVKFGADGVFATFPTGVSAVAFAIKVQKRIAQRNEKATKAERFQVRIGIHLGDVMRERGQLVGDAVNIATQIKPMGDPGGIAMTDTIHSQVKNQLSIKGTFVSAAHHDLPEHLQVFLVPPQGKVFMFWNIGKHLGRTLALLIAGTLAFSGTFFFLNRDTSQRMALFTVAAADPDSQNMASSLREEMDQDLTGIPRLQWIGQEGALFLLSQVPGLPRPRRSGLWKRPGKAARIT